MNNSSICLHFLCRIWTTVSLPNPVYHENRSIVSKILNDPQFLRWESIIIWGLNFNCFSNPTKIANWEIYNCERLESATVNGVRDGNKIDLLLAYNPLRPVSMVCEHTVAETCTNIFAIKLLLQPIASSTECHIHFRKLLSTLYCE